ncbi:DUF6398 domain-containing protein [Synechococcus sp. CBW1108]|uniref:DUF6398 domain-containing protein n=1 Tax=Synechococcus sp. CBW1108 TaxID=1353147 RepID=UPI0018CF85C5|nr:DUF6398 domain-containing protein [Synechococcus sp. CBW1108]QPN71066.1 hypothetical protein H8F27_05570 [Synechococcus sp. CBW1108]
MPATVPGDDGQPVRPLVAMVLESSGRVRGSAIGHPDRPLEALEPAIEMAIEEPQAPCLPGRPRRVVVGSSRLLKLVPPLLPGVMVTRGDTPHLDYVTSSLRNHIAADGDQLGQQGLSTYLSADVTPEAVASFFKAASALYERRPWQQVPSDGHMFTLSCPALRIKGWAGCVIGQNGENYGVILFQSVADYDRYVELAERVEAEGLEVMDGAPPHRAINFESKRDMPPALLEEIRRYRWPVAKGDAYPTVMLVEPDLGLAPPTRADLAQLEAVAGALTLWLDSEPDLARCWAGPSVGRRRFRVPVGAMEVPVTIGATTETIQSPEPQLAADLARFAEPAPRSLKVPAALQAKVTNLLTSIDGFCASHLNDEYRLLIHTAVAALARKRPSPLLGGREPSWCAGVVHAIGSANFLFDKSQTPHCKPTQIYEHFGVSAGTGQAHSKKVRDLLRIAFFSPDWTLPSQLDDSPMAWMVEVDGFIRDVRSLPLEIQLEACARGLIPYVPALRDQARSNASSLEK